MNTHELREAFLRFFEERGHRRVSGAPLVPPGDPTLLFTSAGMVQFKPYFVGQSKPPHPRLASVQKCFRTTDIESVGDTSHLTFFEMLGNFSVGDYFKVEMVPWAWEFVTDVLKLPPERLWASVYLDDQEAYELWRKVGLPEERIVRYGDEHNYWFSGEIGPCGPCSEIYYDFGEQFGCGPSCEPSHECGRFLEIWNLVFMSYYCDGEKRMPLPSKNIDTGSGLERVASVLLFESEGWDKSRLASPYDTDLFAPVVRRIEGLSGKRYGEDEKTDRAMRIVAEHARAVTMLIGDERTPVLPSNEERGYVVRRMLRRAVYFGRRHLGIEEPFMAKLAEAAVETMAPSYPELGEHGAFIAEIVAPEERRFDETLSRGVEMLEDLLANQRARGVLSGADAFLLHDTYGFPVELTREIGAEQGLSVDEAGFEAEMERQRERARSDAFLKAGIASAVVGALPAVLTGEMITTFAGYERLDLSSRVIALIGSGEPPKPLRHARPGATVDVLLAETPFYPEGGGQVGDRGEITGPNGRVVIEDTQRVAERLIVHRGHVVEGRFAVGDEVTARVDPQHRADTMRNHTATHLLHAALRKVLGTHVKQAGSLVAPERLRFDFTHTEPVSREQLAEAERLVNEKVRENVPVHIRLTTFDQAMSEGVLAFSGDKYGEEVRVVEVNTVVPRFSAELCGGTHCERTGDVGLVIVTGESSIGAGMRRIEALSGRGAEERVRALQTEADEIARKLGVPREALLARVDAWAAERESQRRQIERLQRSLASAPRMEEVVAAAVDVDGVKVLASQVDLPSVDALRYSVDAVRKAMPSGVAVIGSVIDGRPQFIAIVSSDVIPKGPRAGEILKRVAAVAGGGGGGRPEMAQGGGKDASKIAAALAVVPDAVREMLSGDGPSGKG